MAKEKCVVCGAETEYDFGTPVDRRQRYVTDFGQLCAGCSETLGTCRIQLGFRPVVLCPHCNAPNAGEGEVGIVICKKCHHHFNR